MAKKKAKKKKSEAKGKKPAAAMKKPVSRADRLPAEMLDEEVMIAGATAPGMPPPSPAPVRGAGMGAPVGPRRPRRGMAAPRMSASPAKGPTCQKPM